MEAEETEMSNPQDDPGHRPPPPRQGEPPPYQGEPQPYQGGSPPSPYQPPPGAPWEGPGGYGPPPQHPAPPSARRTSEGFAGALFDLSFDHMVTTKLIRAVYVLAILVFSIQSIMMLSIGFWVFSWRTGWAWGIFMILGAPVIFLFEIVITRLVLEFVINQFKITEHLKAMREQEGLR